MPPRPPKCVMPLTPTVKCQGVAAYAIKCSNGFVFCCEMCMTHARNVCLQNKLEIVSIPFKRFYS
jgi:hypothetical protein